MDLQIRDEFFRTIPEAMSKVPTFQEALEEAMAQSKQRGVQQTVLQHKFGEMSAHVVQAIETTYGVERLEQWLDQALDSDSLTDLNFPLVAGQ